MKLKPRIGAERPAPQGRPAPTQAGPRPRARARRPAGGLEPATPNDNLLVGDQKRAAPQRPSARSVVGAGEAGAASLRREVIELPGLPLDAAGRTSPQTLQLPSDVVSVLIEVRGHDDGWYLVDSLTGPEGRALVTPSASRADLLDGPLESPNPSNMVMRGSNALLAPNNPGVKLGGGAWTFTAAGQDGQGRPATGAVDVRAIVSSGTPRKTARLPLNLFFTSDKPGYRASDARGSALFEAAVARFKAIYAQAGIEVGPIRIAQQGPVQTPSGPKSAAVVDALRQEAPAPEDVLKSTEQPGGLNVFLAEAVYLERGVVGGVSGSLPGPASPGTTSSGVIFGLAAPLDRPNDFYAPVLGALMAHEVGHYLGLPHTVEADGTEDRLPDTGSTQDGPGNVMYWDEIRADRDFSITRQQAQVMLQHPLLQ